MHIDFEANSYPSLTPTFLLRGAESFLSSWISFLQTTMFDL